jgi:hypothetical protein
MLLIFKKVVPYIIKQQQNEKLKHNDRSREKGSPC